MNTYKGKQVVVLGLGKSGMAAAKLLHRVGAKVVVNDSKPFEQVEKEVQELKDLGIEIIVGHHPDALFQSNIDMIVKNPGIPYHIEPIQKAIRHHVPIITEIELAYQMVSGEFIGITGSNGKTTTTSLTGEILKNAELHPLVGGNIGIPLSDMVLKAESPVITAPIVLELSSFQLQGIEHFHPQIAAIINIYETHLDYHKTMEEYIKAKSNILRNQTKNDFAILNADQAIFTEIAKHTKAEVLWCSRKQSKQYGITIDNHELVYRSDERKVPICDIQEINIPGQHNVENALFASAIAIVKGVSPAIIRNTLMTFRGVEHRLEFVGNFEGVKFYNDSKATNQQATTRALEAFEQKVILIAGGLDRGNDFDEIESTFRNCVQSLIVFGQTAQKLSKTATQAGINHVFHVNDLKEAVEQAKAIANPNDIVLLSPACASWDMFTSFEVRGAMFKKYIYEN
ncbi:UDP-N-acetylmuramoylalanine--D-glutamate ligase [Desulfuribacillus stibiiarsenatis]|uniref:UDP-N-acetylmuramoylalanine--D-glutamate ligase n=1 Tax=Desulfuribacillus stibiiarsenatis TaxID=1390249 RepID=A0A1E5L3J3_9FIRM|nr:UDP-N-acetylmuramoyl-L-alanine--D-glutamate ligase [Desulfuribacillus stibiiarsenatis]OEH84710.1 UDP-N-acetylmuramoylalanine--D-glutamate ligase [Desulfuribacillus stibiiarsenatis]